MGGIFSPDAARNPFFFNATAIYAAYCSSDAWLGDRSGLTYGYYFQGARILAALLKALPMGDASLLVLGGCSAGGRGAFYHLDRVCQGLDIGCVGLLDAAWWVPSSGHEVTARQGLELWAPEALSPCMAALGNASHLCLFGTVWADYVQTPYLIHEELYDHFLLAKRSVTGPVLLWPPSAFAKAEALRSELSRQLGGRRAFAAACYGHCLAEDEGFWSVKAICFEESRGVFGWFEP